MFKGFKNNFIVGLLLFCTLSIPIIDTASFVKAAIQGGAENTSTSWISSSKANIPAGTTGGNLVALGQSFNGFTYVYGGKVLSKGSQGIDCAAFCCRMVAGLTDDDKGVYYSTSGFRDIGTNVGNSDSTGTYSLVAYNSTGIPESDMVAGWILVSSGHAVIYTGNGKTIEAMGSAYGVCEGTVGSGKYTYAFVVNGITYDGTTAEVPSGDDSTDNGGSTDNDDTDGGNTDNGDGTETTSSGTIVLKGAYNENMLASVNTMGECVLTYSDPSSLTVNQTYTLNNWVNTIDSSMQDTVLVTWMRRIVTWLGVAFTLWMIFLYLAYWFDRVNILFEFSLLPLISFNRLMVSPDENKCTWQFSEMIKARSNEPMTVNNRAMIEIVIIGCIFGGLIISGVLFKIVRLIVICVLKILHIV